MSHASLIAHELHKSFACGQHQLPVLKGISAHFEYHNSYAVMGASGSGKSTLMHLLAGLESPSSGEVFFNGLALSEMSKSTRALFLQQTIGMVFQLPYMIKELTVLENVLIRGLVAGINKMESRDRALKLLEAVGLSDKAESKPARLSGGQQQRVAIARAMITRPAFLLADEPTGSLDEYTGNQIVELLLECQQEWGMTIIVSTHDAYVAQQMNNLYLLKDGLLSSVTTSGGNQ